MGLNHKTDGLLLDIALSIGANTGGDLLKLTMPVLVERLNSRGALILRFDGSKISGTSVFDVDKTVLKWMIKKAPAVYSGLSPENPYTVVKEESGMYYAFLLSGFGLLFLHFQEFLHPDFIKKLLPVLGNLANACLLTEKIGSLQPGNHAEAKTRNRKTPVQKSETSLNAIFDNVPFQMWLKDAEGRYLAVNKPYMDYFSITDKSEIIGKDALDVWNKETGRHFKEQDQKVMLSREISSVEEVIDFKHKSVWFEIFRAPIIDEHGNVLGTSGIAQDITGRKANEKALQEALATAEAATEAKSKYLAIMSHEIRNPLNAVVGMVRMLHDARIEGTNRKLVENIKTSSDHLLMIVNDILDFSKIEAGDMVLEETSFDIHDVVQRVYNSHLYIAREKNIDLNFYIDDQLSAAHKGDPLRLQQVLGNLVSNAIKFTPQGKIGIRCELETKPGNNERIRFEVEDTGIGISTESQKKIFESFKQEDISVSRNYGGSGLGLAISKQIVELMGGSLQVESIKNVGSKFFFSIDLKVAEGGKLQPLRIENNNEENQLGGKSILLVEDNKLNQILALTILEKWGASVVIAGNGQQALDCLLVDSFDFILMDIQMPVMDGLTASKHIRETLKITTPILALTANVVKGVAEKCEQAGMQGYISKPFDSDDLYRKMMIHMVKHENSIENQPANEPEIMVADTSRLVKMIGADSAQLKIMISKFLEITPSYLSELNKGDQENNVPVIAAVSHKIKSSIDLVSKPVLRELILDINRLSKDDCNIADVKPLIKKFNSYYRLLEMQLLQEINSEMVYSKVS